MSQGRLCLGIVHSCGEKSCSTCKTPLKPGATQQASMPQVDLEPGIKQYRAGGGPAIGSLDKCTSIEEVWLRMRTLCRCGC